MAAATEARRLAALRSLEILDTEPEERFDRITRLAAAVFEVPIALVTMIDADRQWNKSSVGLDIRQWPRSVSLCAHAIESDDPLVITDVRVDPRFSGHALAGEGSPVCFYAGQPVHAPGGERVGTLCIADGRPRELDAQALRMLGDLGVLVEAELAREELEAALSDLADSQSGLQAIMESTSEGIITFDRAGVLTTANPAAERLFGSEPGGLAGTPVSGLLAEISWPYAEEALRSDRADDGRTLIGRRRIVRGRRRDGTEFPLEFAISTTRVGGAPRYVGVGQDVSGREAAAQELRERERRFRAVFEHAGVGLIISRRGVLLDVNTAFGEMLGRSVADLRGRAWAELSHPDDLAEEQRLADELASGARDFFRREQRFLRRDGSRVWVSVTATLQRSDDNTSLTIAVVEDISERKKIERLKNEFISVVGHELRTPLTSIRGSLGLLAGGVAGDLPAEARQMVQLAVENTDRLVRLVNDTLELERLDAGRMELQRRPADLAELTATALESRRRACRCGRRLVRHHGQRHAPARRSGPGRTGARQPPRQRGQVLAPGRIGRRFGGATRTQGADLRHGRGTGNTRRQARRHLRALHPGRQLRRAGQGRHRARPRDHTRHRRASRGTDLGREWSRGRLDVPDDVAAARRPRRNRRLRTPRRDSGSDDGIGTTPRASRDCRCVR